MYYPVCNQENVDVFAVREFIFMPKVFLSPSTQEWNEYVTGGNEEQYMNLLADKMEPYLRSSGITYVRNDPDRNVTVQLLIQIQLIMMYILHYIQMLPQNALRDN